MDVIFRVRFNNEEEGLGGSALEGRGVDVGQVLVHGVAATRGVAERTSAGLATGGGVLHG